MESIVDFKIGWKLPKRQKHIEDLHNAKGKHQYALQFQNNFEPFEVYKVEIEFAKYRLENGRTQAAQEQYIVTNSEDPDFFTKDAESNKAQIAQHTILRTMFKTPQVDLLKYFEKHEQQEPLILTNDGFVVNGNRRLCAIRDIYYKDKSKYSRFSHVDVVILPSCSEKDLDELEAHLQIRPDIKQEYSWIAKACMLRARQETHNYTNKELEALYEMKKGEAAKSIDLLNYVDSYLLSRDKVKQYHEIENAFYAFNTLVASRDKIKDIAEKDIFTELSYILIDGAGIEGRLYRLIPDVQNYLPTIIERLSEEIPVYEIEENDHTVDILGDATSSPLEPLIESISSPAQKDIVTAVMDDVIASEKAKKAEKKKAKSVLQKVATANTYLRNALNMVHEDSDKQGVVEQIEEIEVAIAKLREWLSNDAKN